MSSGGSETSVMSMKMWYTAPCELVLSMSMAEGVPDDFASKNVQIFLVEFTQPLSLRLCVLLDEDDTSTVFSAPLNQEGLDTCQRIKPAMINMRFGGSGLFLVFPFDMMTEEFLDAANSWFSTRSLAPDSTPPREVPLAQGPQMAGVDVLVVVGFLRKLTSAVKRFLDEEGAESTSGTPSAIGLAESDVVQLV